MPNSNPLVSLGKRLIRAELQLELAVQLKLERRKRKQDLIVQEELTYA